MPELFTVQNIMTFIALVAVLFNVYLHFRRPQEKSAITDAVFEERMLGIKAELTNLKENHIHTLDLKTDSICRDLKELDKSVVRLKTILEERLPPRK